MERECRLTKFNFIKYIFYYIENIFSKGRFTFHKICCNITSPPPSEKESAENTKMVKFSNLTFLQTKVCVFNK